MVESVQNTPKTYTQKVVNNGSVPNNRPIIDEKNIIRGPQQFDNSVSKYELMLNGYKQENEVYIDLGNGYFYKISLLIKDGEQPYYFASYCTSDENGLPVPATKNEISQIDEHCQKLFHKNHDEFMKCISYDKVNKEFLVNIEKPTGPDNVYTDIAETLAGGGI